MNVTEFVGAHADFASLDRQARLDLVLLAERRFGIRFTDEQIEELDTISWPEFVRLTKSLVESARSDC